MRRHSAPTKAITAQFSASTAVYRIKDPLARDFYAEMCCIERWDVRTLRLKIAGMLLPSLGEQKKIADRLDSLDEFIQTEQSKLAKLRQQKQDLMQDLLTGRVRVKMAETASA